MVPPKHAAEGLVYWFQDIGIEYPKCYDCAEYTCVRIMGSHPQINPDKSENEDWIYWKQVYDILKSFRQ